VLIVRLWELLTEQPTVDLARMRPVVQPVRKLLCKSVCESIGGSVGKLIFSAQRDVGGRVRHSISRAARASDAILEKTGRRWLWACTKHEPRLWFEAVELRGLDQCGDNGPVPSATIGKGLIIPWFRQRKLSSGIRFIP